MDQIVKMYQSGQVRISKSLETAWNTAQTIYERVAQQCHHKELDVSLKLMNRLEENWSGRLPRAR